MVSIKEGVIVDIDELMEDQDCDEQNFEEEALAMLESWNRDLLIKEIKDEAEKLKIQKRNRDIQYYDGDTDFDDLAKDMNSFAEGQIYIKVLEPNPEGTQITPNSTILHDRVGYLEYQLTPFESTFQQGKPELLTINEGPLLPGLMFALTELKQGEKANILIKPALAYKDLGAPPLFPGHATLFYHIKIHKVWNESKFSAIEDFEQLRLLSRESFFEEKLFLVEDHKAKANQYLKDDMPKEAVLRYKVAIKFLDEIEDSRLRSSTLVTDLIKVLSRNSAIAYNMLKMHRCATKASFRALSIDPYDLKALYQLAKARIGLSDHSGAAKWIERAHQLSPNNQSFNQLKLDMSYHLKEQNQKKKEIMIKMSKAFS